MIISKIKTATGIALAILMVSTAAGIVAYRTLGQEVPSVLAPAAATPKPPADKAVDLTPLLMAKKDAAVQEHDSRYQEFLAGRATLEILIGSANRLLESKLELCSNKADKIKAYEDHFERLKEIEKVEKTRLEAGRVPIQQFKQAEYSRLQAEIWLIRSGEKPRSVDLAPLLKATRDAATEEHDARYKAFLAGRATLDTLIDSARRLLESKLELSSKRDDGIKPKEEHFERMKEIERVNKVRFGAGRIPVQDHAESQYYRIEAEIWLMRAGGAPKSVDLAPLLKAKKDAATEEYEARHREFLVSWFSLIWKIAVVELATKG